MASASATTSISSGSCEAASSRCLRRRGRPGGDARWPLASRSRGDVPEQRRHPLMNVVQLPAPHAGGTNVDRRHHVCKLWKWIPDVQRGRNPLGLRFLRRFRLARAVEGDRLANERLEGGLVNFFSFVDVDRAACVSVETRVEETGRILQRRALEERQLHDVLVGLACAYH